MASGDLHSRPEGGALMDLRKMAVRVAAPEGKIRTGGTVQFVKDSGPLRRDIRAPGFEWSPDAFNSLAKILWGVQRAHSYAMAALRQFSRTPSSQFSPDGLLGGRGYIQSVKDMRAQIGQSVEILSSTSDTLHDEINADHWRSADDSSGSSLLEDVEQVKGDPEQFVDSQYDEVSGQEEGSFSDAENPVSNPDPDSMNPQFESGDPPEDEEGDEGFQAQASDLYWATGAVSYAGPYDKSVQGLVSKRASSSIAPETLPGPRVDHIGPTEGQDAGHFNWEDLWPSDDPSGSGLTSGVNESDPLYDDASFEGGSDPTDGDSSTMKVGYSWLPGSRNEKIVPIYDRDLSAEDADWMIAHSDPDYPGTLIRRKPSSNLWEEDFR